MSRTRREQVYRCQQCGGTSAKWLGRCAGCGAWNSLVEEAVGPDGDAAGHRTAPRVHPLSEIPAGDDPRCRTGLEELDRVLGGGLVPGSLVLLGGEPGVGKSTLLLQAAAGLAREDRILYVAAEESGRQIRLRTDRLGIDGTGIWLLSENVLETVIAAAEAERPAVVVVDSVQAIRAASLESSPGTVSQVREVAGRLLPLAKSRDMSVLLVGHVNKEGALAGPKALEHAVDVVLDLEGDRHHAHRVLRSVKNRFGPAGELGVFQMTDAGMIEVPDPSSMLLKERPRGVPGSAVTCCVEGSRCLLVEVQALVGSSTGGSPRRTTLGLDSGRIALILAVLERRAGLALSDREIFVSAVGGLSLREPAADLAVAAALASAAHRYPLDPDEVLFGELGLAGEVRRVGRARQRLREATRHGFRRAVIPSGNHGDVEGVEIEVLAPRGLAEVLGRHPSCDIPHRSRRLHE